LFNDWKYDGNSPQLIDPGREFTGHPDARGVYQQWPNYDKIAYMQF